MDEKLSSNRDKWLISILVTFLVAGAIEIFIPLLLTINTFRGDSSASDFVPWTFHTLWEIAALVAIFNIIWKFGIKTETIYCALVFGGIISGLIWIFIPNDWKLLKANYWGVESRISMDEHDGRYDSPLVSGFLYERDDPELLDSMREKAEYNEHVATKGFLFWQTGLAYGFHPAGIPQYNWCESLTDRIELFFTVGPMTLVESFMKGLFMNFPVMMLAQIIIFLKTKRHFWWWA